MSYGVLAPWHINQDEEKLSDNDVLVIPITRAVYCGHYNYNEYFHRGKLCRVDTEWYEHLAHYLLESKDDMFSIDPLHNK